MSDWLYILNNNPLVLTFIAVIGLCLGSFYNVVIIRSLKDESIVFPASKCPHCEHPLYFWHNIPILSYLILRGKCYFCNEKISFQYPLVEFITMLFFILSYMKFGISLTLAFSLIWLSLLLIMTVTDFKEKLVDCTLAIAMAISGVIYSFLTFGVNGLINSALAIIAAIILMELIARSGYLITKSRAMGEADTYVAAAIGSVCGIKNLLYVLAYGLIASMIIILPIFLYNRFKQNDKTTCILSILFILGFLVFKTFNNIYIFIIILILAILLIISILKNMKSKSDLTYLPYVPALFAGFLYYLFFNI